MTFKRTALYRIHGEGLEFTVRNFVSEKELTDERIRFTVESSVEYKNLILGFHVVDTPESEEIKPKRVTYLAQSDLGLYISLEEEGECSLFWDVETNMPLTSILGILVTVQRNGRMARNTREHSFWGGEREDLTIVGKCDDDGINLIYKKMHIRTKLRLEF